MVTTSAVLGAASSKKARDVETAAKNHQPFDPAVEKAGKSLSAGAVVTGLVGLAAGITGYLLWPSAPQTETSSGVSAMLYPLAGPGLAGVGGSFAF